MTTPLIDPDTISNVEINPPSIWAVIVHDDPVNLMSYVTHVFMTYFGYDEPKAHKLMMQVHTEGKSCVATGSRELMETHTAAMHSYGLWATCQLM
ncbi:MAG: ATP-dependent Clp protease adapter ClpS [Propionibacteriaceae bacterium]|jgi:ATP-dependent Clp protease adaptor protein ClpS|nr:ATP-dependent Clp protease adapter ClpS [Propionibacteriaceae bacterium]